MPLLNTNQQVVSLFVNNRESIIDFWNKLKQNRTLTMEALWYLMELSDRNIAGAWRKTSWNLGFEHLQTTLPGPHPCSILLPLYQWALPFSQFTWLKMATPAAPEFVLSQSHFQNSWGKASPGCVVDLWNKNCDQEERQPSGNILATWKPHPWQIRKKKRHFLVNPVENHSQENKRQITLASHFLFYSSMCQ